MLSCRTGNDAFAGTVAAGVNYEPINLAVVSEVVNILYIHGMGGGGDSRIPSILKERIGAALPESFPAEEVNVVVRTYDFEPETGHMQIMAWVEELRPALVIGESLGSLQALRIRGVPRLFVSPSLNAPIYLGYLSFLTLVPGVTWLLDWIYRPRPGDRQPLHFTFRNLYLYIAHRKAALSGQRLSVAGRSVAGRVGDTCRQSGSVPESACDYCFAFFGEHDHYRRSGVVSIRTWKRHFGEGTWTTYPGMHFMEEEYVMSMLVPEIVSVLLAVLRKDRPVF